MVLEATPVAQQPISAQSRSNLAGALPSLRRGHWHQDGRRVALEPFVAEALQRRLQLSKDAFSSLTSFLEARSGISPFKGKRANVTSLGPFGVRGGLAGVSVAPKFLCLGTWLPFLQSRCKDQADPALALGSPQVGSLPLSSPLLFSPVREGFSRLFPSP